MSKSEKIEETGGELTTIPNDKYVKFFGKFAEIDTLPVEQWKMVHLLGYFCRKYKEAYGVDYPWKFNHQNPNKCFEVWQMNTLVAKLSANPKILRDYIDWAYQTLVPQAKRRLTSISFMTKDEVVNPYKVHILLAGKKDLNVSRASPLPPEYRTILDKYGLGLSTYGDLAFVSQMEPPAAMGNIEDALAELCTIGFEREMLRRIV